MKTINTMEKQQSNLVVSLKFQSYATPAETVSEAIQDPNTAQQTSS